MSGPTPGGAAWAVATRICQLDANGFVDSGVPTFTTREMVKATHTPVTEAGDAIAIKNASGDLSVFAVHGDMVKWGTLSIEFAVPDPQLEAAISGGTVISSSASALGVPTGLTATPQTTLGVLAAQIYGYRATQYNSFGESLAEAEVQATVTGSTGAVVLTGVTPAAGALGIGYYGRNPGGEQLLGYQPVIGTQATSAASGTGSVANLSVTALTKPIPAGFTFQIAGDTNAVKIVFTTLAEVGIGAISVPVSVSQSVTTTIAAGNIVPCWVDTGAQVPSGNLPAVDLSAGPGTGVGYAASSVGPVANPNGVSIEFWQKRIINGYQATDYPYWRILLPRVCNGHTMPRDHTNANLQTLIEAQSFQNPNWGTGPDGTWPGTSTQLSQRVMSGAQVLPSAGLSSVAAGL